MVWQELTESGMKLHKALSQGDSDERTAMRQVRERAVEERRRCGCDVDGSGSAGTEANMQPGAGCFASGGWDGREACDGTVTR